MPLTIGSLFSGLGGFDLGLESAGLGPVLFQVEIDPFCRRVLEKHWPKVTRFDDVTKLRSYPAVDVLCGGFPCQDVSSCGKRRGLAGEKSGLWFEFARIVREVRPRFVLVENVASGAKRWLPQIRRDLRGLGYRTRAYALSASDVGAPHQRRRIFVVAHADRQGEPALPVDAEVGRASAPLADAYGDRPRRSTVRRKARSEPWSSAQPGMVHLVHGVSSGLGGRGLAGRQRRALGNAIVPACAEVIGRIVMEMAWSEAIT